jgi:hypothetical protein
VVKKAAAKKATVNKAASETTPKPTVKGRR